jgi:class 3 adenylate cyclase/predicted ATPase
MSDIASWLSRLGLDKYIETFSANEIDRDALPHLSDDDLKELGLPLGPRRKILAAIVEQSEQTRQTTGVAAPPVVRRSQAERRQLTVMFVDLVGSTELSQRLDPEEMRDLVGAYQRVVSAEIARYEGRVAKLMGDGILAYFGWPLAHEDDAERAVRAGLAAAAATARLPGPSGARHLAARVGIATGVVVVGDLIGEGSAQEEAVIGETPNLAARLQALAEPNAVVVADGTLRLIGGLFETADLGRRELKGFETPIRAWRITGEADTQNRFAAFHGVATPLEGRAEELRLLLQRWRQALAGEGQVVLMSGEPGIGKSRLVAELQERLGNEPHTLLRYFCSPFYVNSALYPAIKQLERAAGFRHDDNTDTKLDKLELLLHRASSNVAEASPLFAGLLSIDHAHRYPPSKLTAQAQKSRILNALVEQLRGVAQREPVLMLVEDAHWIDPTTSEWLGMVIDVLQNLRALLVVTFRPEFEPRWTRFSHVTSLSLSRLGRKEGEAIIDRVAGGKSLPKKIKDQILLKTEGIPLFVEELAKTVLESGLLMQIDDHYELSGAQPFPAIPSTLQDSLMARLDRLDEVKEIAQIGACIGRAFHYPILAAVTGWDDTRLETALRQLEDSELVFRRGTIPEASYTFKHAMVQDAAYQSLLKSRRQDFHARIAEMLESQFPETVESEPETLAHHYTAAGHAERAVSCWLKAGRQAQKQSANREAIAHLKKGLELIAILPDSENRLRQEIELQTALGISQMAAKGFGSPEVLQAFSNARILSKKLGDPSQLFIALCGEASYHMISGNLRASDELGEECLKLARAIDDPALLLEAHHRQWATKHFLGDHAAAERHIEWGMATYDPERHHALTYIYTGHDPGVCCRSYSAEILWIRGYPDQALSRMREAVTLADRVEHPFSRVLAQLSFSHVLLLRREPEEAGRWLAKSRRMSAEFGFALSNSVGRFQTGWALLENGHVADAVSELRAGIADITATGAANGMPLLLSVVARACGKAGETGEGLEIVEKALEIGQSGAKCYLAEVLRTKGELLLLRNPSDESAEGWFQQAIALAQEMQTKSLELRAAFSLASHYMAKERHRDACEVLTPVYSWFSEGSATGDLMEAKALLDQLRSANAFIDSSQNSGAQN